MAGKAGPRQMRRLLDAVLTIGSELDVGEALQRIAEAATDLVDARYGALGVLDRTGTHLAQFITVGIDEDGRRVIGTLPSGHGILGLLIVDPKPLRLPDLREHPDSYGFPANHPPMQSFLGVPILVRGTIFGNLYLCDKQGAEVFTDIDEELVTSLAVAAGVAIENARLHARVGELAMFEDRERIARDLHDTVIQRLFATGLSLQATISLVDEQRVVDRLETVIRDIDETAREIRSAIFELHTARLPGRSVRPAIIDLCSETERSMGFEPTVRFDGPIDSSLDDIVSDHLLAAVREMLSNVTRHAKASHVSVSIRAHDCWLNAAVSDNGIGIADVVVAGRGLENLQVRARALGGDSNVSMQPGGGTLATWNIPLQ